VTTPSSSLIRGRSAYRSSGRLAIGLALAVALTTSGCATLQQLVALESVDFDLAGLTRVEVGGVDVTAVRSPTDIGVADGLSLAGQVRAGTLPLALTLDVRAENPESNADARMVRMDWTLYLDDLETVSGRVAEEVSIPSGTATTFPVQTELDLLEFFDGGAADLIELVQSIAGLDGTTPSVALHVLPVVRTAFGDIPYDRPFRITLSD
jgi:hypothetical protein